jgi:hypothetical protein
MTMLLLYGSRGGIFAPGADPSPNFNPTTTQIENLHSMEAGFFACFLLLAIRCF